MSAAATKRARDLALVGTTMPWTHGAVRVMAVADGWAMVRYSGCSPFALPLKSLRAFAVTLATAMQSSTDAPVVPPGDPR